MKLKLGSWTLTPYLIVIALVGLQACGGDGSPATNANPTGYYDNSGTATIDDNGTDTGVATGIADLQAMINGNRFMMISDAEGLFYDGTITSISINDFAANVSVYKHGPDATITGTITEKSKITGALTGTGAGNGSFTLQYALSNNQAADLSRIEKSTFGDVWEANIGNATSGETTGFQINNGGITGQTVASADGFFQTCIISSGSFVPVNGTSLYEVTLDMTLCDPNTQLNLTYVGLAASWTDTATDNRLAIGATDSNKTYGINGDFR